MIPKDWPRLLNFPEIRNDAQYFALLNDTEHRQATHIFLYFVTADCNRCYEQIDEINEAWLKAIETYGIDSVIFYKIVGKEFASEYGIHTYPTLTAVANQTQIKQGEIQRLSGSLLTKNNIAKFVMEHVDEFT